MQVHGKAKVDMPLWPTFAESVYMAKGLNDNEEDQYMQENPNLVGLFEIDVASLVQKHSLITTRSNPSVGTKTVLINHGKTPSKA